MGADSRQGTVFEASNRYFTSKRDVPNMEPIPISPLIDRGILETLLLHGKENEVHYYQVHENTLWGRKRYERHIPISADHDTDKETSVERVKLQIFGVGYIIEVQVSFIAVPLKDNRYK
jgi:hypothetical protein